MTKGQLNTAEFLINLLTLNSHR